ncbi:3-deoxy-7-phosphoheptulonate synthase [Rhizoctonia solani]|uniref:Phospho-2-dehydro-3-deoxyheptonate aldolase n=1 Tax=Rhizoctonia solani TaxID=456999 RepID=A0A8H8T418_9AGAM|nr:3-deoxy-7-phosphoheptulonate synthase [Rhizoctonia solani]QRW27088.1 3-deoxy-7-phosphoheptulonate synthase [Rhizoctonia solani]
MDNSTTWTPSSWRNKPIAQDVKYENKAELDEVIARIKRLPPLVSQSEASPKRAQGIPYPRTHARMADPTTIGRTSAPSTHARAK